MTEMIDTEHLIKIITDRTTLSQTGCNETFDIDTYERIIMSPKIIYGLDRLLERRVYCYYKEHTIMPYGIVPMVSLFCYHVSSKLGSLNYCSRDLWHIWHVIYGTLSDITFL